MKKIIIIGDCHRDIDLPETIKSYLERFGPVQTVLWTNSYEELCTLIKENSSIKVDYYFSPTRVPSSLRRVINQKKREFFPLLEKSGATLGYLEIKEYHGYSFVSSVIEAYNEYGEVDYLPMRIKASVDQHFLQIALPRRA